MKKKIFAVVLAALAIVAGIAAYDAQDKVWAQDIYDMKMHIYVPRIYDNTQSLGYRKYQAQVVQGEMLKEPEKHGLDKKVCDALKDFVEHYEDIEKNCLSDSYKFDIKLK